MNCVFCRHPLLMNGESLTKERTMTTITCTVCRAVYRVQLTVLHEPEHEGEELEARTNKPGA